MMRVPLPIAVRANTPRPWTGESRTSMSVDVTTGGPPRVGWDWSNSLTFGASFFLFIRPISNCNGRLDRRMVLVVHDLKVFEVVVENSRRPALQVELGQCQRHARQLLVHLLEMIEIQMAVAAGPDEFSGL